MSRTALRWLGYIAVAVVFAIACAYLSHWQFTRNQERERQLALIEANYDAPAVPLSQLVTDAATSGSTEHQWHPVSLTGTYLANETLLVRNRPHGGTAAFEVLVPFQTVEGEIFIVNRGWVAPGKDQPEPDVIPAPPSGEVHVVARLMPGEPLRNATQSAPPGQVPTINLPLIAETIEAPGMVTSDYGLLASEDPAPAEAPTALLPPSQDPGPYLSYAIQWILFAIMGFAFIWYMIRTERRHRREDADDARDVVANGDHAEDDASATIRRRAAVRGGRVRDRDMEDEDALLDATSQR